MDRATLVTGRSAVMISVMLPRSQPELWRSLTDPGELSLWFPCGIVIDGPWEKGARLSFPFPEDVIDMTLAGTVLEAREPELLSYTWGEGESLRFEVEAFGEQSKLTLTDELAPAHAARNAAGWEECLARLAGVTPERTWKEAFDEYERSFSPVLGAQEGPPPGMKVEV